MHSTMVPVETEGQPTQTRTDADSNNVDPEAEACLSVVASNVVLSPTATIETPASPVPRSSQSIPSPRHYLNESESSQGNATTLDFIATSRSVKNLFSLPYSTDRPLHVAVHNMEGTLIIDTIDEDETIYNNEEKWKYQGQPETGKSEPDENVIEGQPQEKEQSEPSSPSSASQSLALALTSSFPGMSPSSPRPESAEKTHNSEALAILSRMIHQVRKEQMTTQRHSAIMVDPATVASSSSSPTLPPKPPLEYVEWAFQDMNLLVGSDALIVRSDPAGASPSKDSSPPSSATTAVAIRVEDVNNMKTLLDRHLERVRSGEFIPDHQLAKLQQQGKPSYAQALLHSQKQQKQPQLLGEEKQSEDREGDQQTDESDGGSFSAPNLDRVRLQTCIVPSTGPLGGLLAEGPSSSRPSTTSQNTSDRPSASASSPVRIVLDAYLDNVIANVPQLALCLREKGFIQSVKLLQTKEIPSMLLEESTLDTSLPFEHVAQTPTSSRNIFSPKIMEMNASALLRFLQTNCSRDNATYLLRREAGETNIQLYDISSISRQRQRTWSRWLATMSYRFALRLRHLELHLAEMEDKEESGKESTTKTQSSTSASLQIQRRQFRDRQRSLLHTTLELLDDLADMDGQAQESLIAAVNEHIADTFLGPLPHGHGSHDEGEKIDDQTRAMANKLPHPRQQPAPVMATAQPSSQNSQSMQQPQPYSDIPVDGLNKAQDHLINGIKSLRPVLEKNVAEQRQRQEERNRRRRRRRRPRQTQSRQQQRPIRVTTAREGATSSSGSDEDYNSDSDQQITFMPSEAIILQLFGLHSKLINVSLRLAEHHLRNYWSSSAMQALRTSARRMADSGSLLYLLSQVSRVNSKTTLACAPSPPRELFQTLQLQYTWLWEHCGHFARSFASDELWRERGHACGDDVISVLRDVEAAFAEKDHALTIGGMDDSDEDGEDEFTWYSFCKSPDPLTVKTDGLVDLHSLTAIVDPQKGASAMPGIASPSSLTKNPVTIPSQVGNSESVTAAVTVLGFQGQLQRDKRQVLVASCVSYGRAIRAFEAMLPVPENASKSDITDQMDPPILHLLRQRLGDSFNETGKVLLDALRSLLTSQTKLGKKNDPKTNQLAAEALLFSAQFWFSEGLDTFERCRDLRNVTLLRLNLCQCFKLRANSSFATTDRNPSDGSTHAEYCLQEAAKHLQAAHETLGQRDVDPMTWDMVSEELAATFLVLGARRRQSLLGGGNAPILSPSLRLPPGKERSIFDPMERSLKIYEELGNSHQAAAVHYQLALTNSKVWTCQRNEAKTREKLSAAFQHYNMAFAYFNSSMLGNEPTFVLLCLDLASLYAAVSGEECLSKALDRCLDTSEAFSQKTIDYTMVQKSPAQRTEWFSKMGTLASSVEDRVFKLLRSLVKIDNSKIGMKYKDLYRAGLSAKMVQTTSSGEDVDDYDPNARQLLALHDILVSLKRELG